MLRDPSDAGQYVPIQSTLPVSTVHAVRLVEPDTSVSNPAGLKLPASKLPLLTPEKPRADPAIDSETAQARKTAAMRFFFMEQ